MSKPFKIPQSVLVLIHTPALDVLLIKRADAEDFWQSVTGSKDWTDEPYRETACPAGTLTDWQLENVYDIYPRWQHRYRSGVTRNTEHLFGLTVPAGTAVRLDPREHTAYRWLPYHEAAVQCFSSSNAEAILMLPRFSVARE